MKRSVLPLLWLALVAPSVAWAQEIDQKSAFGSIARGATICVGPVAPSDMAGVEISGYTNGPRFLIWQVYSLPADGDGAAALVFSAMARSVDRIVSPMPGLVYEACVTRGPLVAEDFELALHSAPLE